MVRINCVSLGEAFRAGLDWRTQQETVTLSFTFYLCLYNSLLATLI